MNERRKERGEIIYKLKNAQKQINVKKFIEKILLSRRECYKSQSKKERKNQGECQKDQNEKDGESK